MIKAKVFRNNSGDVYSFKVSNHGDPIVCSAVSILSFNAVNSIISLTSLASEDYYFKQEESGFISFNVVTHKVTTINKDVALLLNSFYLGLKGITESYPKEINLKLITE